ncbi:MAG TPA: hypothetical protein VMC10_20575 [Stellaceae bacterium]|nr:hypothetical protein [Stellaceae bacterium]
MAITLAHIPDAAWIIALYKAIHGGDPAPDQQTVAVQIGGEMMSLLAGKASATVSVSALERTFKTLGMTVTASEVETRGATTEALTPIHQGTQTIRLCFGVGTGRQCIDVTIPKLQVGPSPN